MLNKHLPTEAVTEVVEKLDIDRDGKIPVEQLINIIKKKIKFELYDDVSFLNNANITMIIS